MTTLVPWSSAYSICIWRDCSSRWDSCSVRRSLLLSLSLAFSEAPKFLSSRVVFWSLANVMVACLVLLCILKIVPDLYQHFPVLQIDTLFFICKATIAGLLVVVPAPVLIVALVCWRETTSSSISAYCCFLRDSSLWIVSRMLARPIQIFSSYDSIWIMLKSPFPQLLKTPKNLWDSVARNEVESSNNRDQ